MNGLGLIDAKHTSESRQQKRHSRFMEELAKLRHEFGGFTRTGGFYWPQLMPRRIARQIARVKAKAA